MIPLSTSSVFTSPPVVIDAPGKIASNAIRSIGVVPLTTSGPDRSASWKPSMSPICAAVDRDLADVEEVAPVRLAVGEAVGEALLLRLPERIDRQLGILGRAIDDDARRGRPTSRRPERSRSAADRSPTAWETSCCVGRGRRCPGLPV